MVHRRFQFNEKQMMHTKTVTRLIVVLSLMPVLASFPSVLQAEQTKLISSIETQSQLDSQWSSSKGTMSLSSEHVTHGSHSLKIDFEPGVAPQFEFRNGLTDVSSFDKIKFDIYLEGTPMIITAKFTQSGWAASYRSWYYLYNEGFNTIEYSIPGIASKVDTSRLFIINFYAESPYTGDNHATLYIDNLRATKGPNDDEWLRNTDPGHPIINVPGNVLQNGDFELGLQNWGSWGTWENGEYLFGSATGDNTKSGIYSAQISCQTIGRGGIMTSVNLQPGDYQLEFWVKGSAPGTEMFYWFSGNIISSGQSCPRTAIESDWTKKSYPVTVNQTGQVMLYLFSTGSNKLYFDAVSLVRVDYSGSIPPKPPEQTPRAVTLDDQTILVDNEPFFPIGIYGGVPAELTDTGFNMVSTATGNTTIEDLDDIHDHGLMTWGNLTGIARAHVPTQAARAAGPIKNHPAILCWYNCDEPDHSRWNVPPPEIRFMSKVLSEEDDGHPTAAIMMPWAPSNLYQYAHTVDIAMTDPYSTDISTVITQIDTLRAAVGPDKPMWLALLSNYNNTTGPTPVAEYLYACTYAALTHSANGLFWFAYNPDTYPAAWKTLTDISLELKELTPALVARTSPKKVTVSNPNIHTILKQYNGSLCLIAVNVSATPANSVRLTIPQLTAAHARVKFEDRTESITAGIITDDFKPHQRHVYQIGAGFTQLAAFATQWLNNDCRPENNWCNGIDFDKSTTVNFKDYSLLSNSWQTQ